MPIGLEALIHNGDDAIMDWLIELVPYGEDAVALLPDEILETTGWKFGDELDWEAKPGRLILTRRTAPKDDSDPTQPS